MIDWSWQCAADIRGLTMIQKHKRSDFADPYAQCKQAYGNALAPDPEQVLASVFRRLSECTKPKKETEQTNGDSVPTMALVLRI